jgi:hypothetical protein
VAPERPTDHGGDANPEDQWDQVELRVGNNIGFPVGVEAQVTKAATGNKVEYVDYSVWTVDTAVAVFAQELGATFGQPTPQDIIIAAAASTSHRTTLRG